jgi:hypothetical protein
MKFEAPTKAPVGQHHAPDARPPASNDLNDEALFPFLAGIPTYRHERSRDLAPPMWPRPRTTTWFTTEDETDGNHGDQKNLGWSNEVKIVIAPEPASKSEGNETLHSWPSQPPPSRYHVKNLSSASQPPCCESNPEFYSGVVTHERRQSSGFHYREMPSASRSEASNKPKLYQFQSPTKMGNRGRVFTTPNPGSGNRRLNAESDIFVPVSQQANLHLTTPASGPKARRSLTEYQDGQASPTTHAQIRSRSSLPDLLSRSPPDQTWHQHSPQAPGPFIHATASLRNLKLTFSSQDPNTGLAQGMFDPYGSSPSMSTTSHGQPTGQINPYLHDHAANGGASFFTGNAYAQPLNYHLYVPQAPFRDNLPPLAPNQRMARDFFISDTLREELQRKSAATMQMLPRTFHYPS